MFGEKEGNQTKNRQLYCCKCGSSDRKYVELECQHIFCILCAAFMYIKSRISVENQSSISCAKCNIISQLDVVFIDLINKTLKQQVIPSLDPTESFTTENKIHSKINEKTHFIETINRKIKSQEHSFENITPSTAKYFFSKCESPSSRKKRDNRKYCKHHTMDEISFLCLNCECEMLCVKCISSNKKHSTHQVMDINKAIEIIKQQLNFTRLNIMHKMGEFEMWQKKIDDKSLLVRDKAVKTINDIHYGFDELVKKLKEKQNEIVQACEYHFQNLQKNLNIEYEKMNYCIEMLRKHNEKILSTQNQRESFEFLQKYKQIKKVSEQILYNNSPPISLEKLACPSNSIYRQIAELSQRIVSLQIQYKQSNLGHVDIENCRSESKIKKDKSYKRVRTNIGSLNSSRDKKEKKYTKTEEDEKRMKNDRLINYRNEKRNSAKMPAYISDFINKKGNKCGSGANSYMFEMTANLESSKMISKMSKTIVPDELRKKKEHAAVIKERIERKTVHPNFRSQKTGESNKKKRNHKD